MKEGLQKSGTGSLRAINDREKWSPSTRQVKSSQVKKKCILRAQSSEICRKDIETED